MSVRPKYLVMRGVRVGNRMILFIGSHPEYSRDEYGNKVVRFSNRSGEYYQSNIYRKIRTFKQLIKWYRLIGSGSRVIEKVGPFGHRRVRK